MEFWLNGVTVSREEYILAKVKQAQELLKESVNTFCDVLDACDSTKDQTLRSRLETAMATLSPAYSTFLDL